MSNRQRQILEWIVRELTEEQLGGFSRLRRVPDTVVVSRLDYWESLAEPEQKRWLETIADWAAHRFEMEIIPPPIYQAFAAATATASAARGIRYMGLHLLAGLAKEASGVEGWAKANNITGLALLPPPELVPDPSCLEPAKPAALKRLIKKEFAQRFQATASDEGDGFCRYQGSYRDEPLEVLIRYSTKMLRAQVDYSVLLPSQRWVSGPYGVCCEHFLGIGSGHWNYLSVENAERSIGLLGDLVTWVADLPERIAWARPC